MEEVFQKLEKSDKLLLLNISENIKKCEILSHTLETYIPIRNQRLNISSFYGNFALYFQKFIKSIYGIEKFINFYPDIKDILILNENLSICSILSKSVNSEMEYMVSSPWDGIFICELIKKIHRYQEKKRCKKINAEFFKQNISLYIEKSELCILTIFITLHILHYFCKDEHWIYIEIIKVYPYMDSHIYNILKNYGIDVKKDGGLKTFLEKNGCQDIDSITKNIESLRKY